MRYVQKCTQQQKWQKREHNGEFGKYGENDNFARIANKAKHKAMRRPIKVGDTGEFGKYGTSCLKNLYAFQCNLSFVFIALLCQLSRVFISCLISGETNGFGFPFILILLIGACSLRTSRNSILYTST